MFPFTTAPFSNVIGVKRSLRLFCPHFSRFSHIYGDRQLGFGPGFHPASSVRRIDCRHAQSKECNSPSSSILYFINGNGALTTTLQILGLPHPRMVYSGHVPVRPLMVSGSPTVILFCFRAWAYLPACSVNFTFTHTNFSHIADSYRTPLCCLEELYHMAWQLYPRRSLETAPWRRNGCLSGLASLHGHMSGALRQIRLPVRMRKTGAYLSIPSRALIQRLPNRQILVRSATSAYKCNYFR